jgi:hypothetical protein
MDTLDPWPFKTQRQINAGFIILMPIVITQLTLLLAGTLWPRHTFFDWLGAALFIITIPALFILWYSTIAMMMRRPRERTHQPEN